MSKVAQTIYCECPEYNCSRIVLRVCLREDRIVKSQITYW